MLSTFTSTRLAKVLRVMQTLSEAMQAMVMAQCLPRLRTPRRVRKPNVEILSMRAPPSPKLAGTSEMMRPFFQGDGAAVEAAHQLMLVEVVDRHCDAHFAHPLQQLHHLKADLGVDVAGRLVRDDRGTEGCGPERGPRPPAAARRRRGTRGRPLPWPPDAPAPAYS